MQPSTAPRNSRPSSRVHIDEHKIIWVNDRPFFPIGARHMPVGATPELLRQAGFNSIRWTPFGVDSCEEAFCEAPPDFAGLKFYPYVFTRGDLSADVPQREHELRKLVAAVRDHPNLLCYEQRNEPASTFRDYAKPQSPPEGLIAGSSVIRSLDPYHPIRVGHTCGNLVSTLKKYNPAVDIVGCNPYVVMAPGMRPFVGTRPDGLLIDCPDQTLSAVGQYTGKMIRVAEGRAVWMQIQGSANENWYSPAHTPESKGHGRYEHHSRYPSRWEMRFMAFIAIIRGATAMEWMLVGLRVGRGAWLDLCQVIGELNSLHDVLASPAWRHSVKVSYTELGFSDWDGVVTLAKLAGDTPWILAANTQFDPALATLSNLPPGLERGIRVAGEEREIEVRDGAFVDRFQPYEVHVYTART